MDNGNGGSERAGPPSDGPVRSSQPGTCSEHRSSGYVPFKIACPVDLYAPCSVARRPPGLSAKRRADSARRRRAACRLGISRCILKRVIRVTSHPWQSQCHWHGDSVTVTTVTRGRDHESSRPVRRSRSPPGRATITVTVTVTVIATLPSGHAGRYSSCHCHESESDRHLGGDSGPRPGPGPGRAAGTPSGSQGNRAKRSRIAAWRHRAVGRRLVTRDSLRLSPDSHVTVAESESRVRVSVSESLGGMAVSNVVCGSACSIQDHG